MGNQQTLAFLDLLGEPTGHAREAPMDDEQYLAEKANRCFEIARTCLDLDAARKINALGNEFRSKAAEHRKRARFRDSDRDFAA